MHRLLHLALMLGMVGNALAARPGRAPLEAGSMGLRGGWAIQSSTKVAASGEALSQPGAAVADWHPAQVPTTVVSALVADGTYPDPFVGMNLRRIPGTTYPVGENFSVLELPKESPFAVPWWFRTEFRMPAGAPAQVHWLRFGGVNFAFDAWLNGTRIARASETAGAYRTHEFDVTSLVRPGRNALAVRVFAPRPDDLAITFVDWNPLPPDKLMGLFRPVTVRTTGPLSLRHPQVVSRLRLPSLDRADLTVKAFVRNASMVPRQALLRGRIGKVSFEQRVTLAAGEAREVAFTPTAFPQLVFRRPQLWWPHPYGKPVLHDLQLELTLAGRVSDHSASRFGIRQIDAVQTAEGHLLFKVNGRPILIRGAGWSSDLMLRPSPGRERAELRYAKDMGLNTIRLEGQLPDESFFDATDREGLLVMAGWSCCDHWEQWEHWKDKDLPVATASLRDQLLRLRGRASVLAWLNGSDGPPPATVERAYLDRIRDLGFPNPVISSASDKAAEGSGPSGVKMRGPYEWVPPSYWYGDTKFGGPHGFATEISPGPAPPPLESLRRFLPEDQLWPIGEAWNYHCGGGVFSTLGVFNAALEARYGAATGVADYALKAQVAAYESHRAMFESFGARKYRATGVIQWMLNNAWPGLIWHLYDVYLRPGGAYFGTKKACEPLHVQYSYDDRSVLVVNSTLRPQAGLAITARVVGLDGKDRLTRTAKGAVGPDGVLKALVLPPVAETAGAYFLFLTLADAAGAVLSRNVYWLSTNEETLDWNATQWYRTPVRQYADLKGLGQLPAVVLQSAATFEAQGTVGSVRLRLQNPTGAIAFFLRPSVRRRDTGEELLPVLWDDAYVTLLPGETRLLRATYDLEGLQGTRPSVTVEGWNVARTDIREQRLGAGPVRARP